MCWFVVFVMLLFVVGFVSVVWGYVVLVLVVFVSGSVFVVVLKVVELCFNEVVMFGVVWLIDGVGWICDDVCVSVLGEMVLVVMLVDLFGGIVVVSYWVILEDGYLVMGFVIFLIGVLMVI